MILWQRCELCEDFVCNWHGVHAWECDCPDIDYWAEHDVDPYDEMPWWWVEFTGESQSWREQRQAPTEAMLREDIDRTLPGRPPFTITRILTEGECHGPG